jgi:hypothetical protein
MDTLDTKKTAKNCRFLECKMCNFKCSKNSGLMNHYETKKHKKREMDTNGYIKSAKLPYFCECGKQYKYSQGLSKHKKQCETKEEENTIIDEENPQMFTLLLTQNMELIKQNQEFKDLLAEQHKSIIDLVGKLNGSTNTNCHNNTNSNNTNNNQFNLQFFLNEQCKDALNIEDFINQLQVKVTDLDMMGRIGFTEGISKIFIRGLKELDVFKRPIHCSDLKREVMYVKDNDSWEKDTDEKSKMKNAIKFIAAKNFNQLNEWIEENPEYNDYDSKKHKEYHNIIIKAAGGATPEEDEKNFNKIIRTVAPEITIDKSGEK